MAGCGGMLGDAMYQRLQKVGAVVKASDVNCIEDWLEYADVRDFNAIRKHILDFEPQLIINLAALTDLEYCEQEQENSWLTNAFGAENLGLIAAQLDVPYVYISTAGIFGGERDLYHDFHAPNPLSVYAQSKYYGEQYVRTSIKKHFVLRAGWMMGGGPAKDKKFINKIYKQIQAGATELCVVDDKLGTPTYTVDFANGLCGIVESDQYGLYNQVCGGAASRFEVAQEFVRLLGLADTIKVKVVPSDYFKSQYFAPRPASEKLVNLKLNQRGLNLMRDWKVCLQEYAEVFKADLLRK
ncbi:SDR family oxidoreductase [Rhodoferax saidenbachensis]|uniref:SDR family oxidoreductase n=1 Tax=Rhodoferax saidenbachensis TaxID=1484693 RepID=UPI0004B024A0|nr:NAD(P)-dependent oxidoreductase [Rhodoferax saidenbachensis]